MTVHNDTEKTAVYEVESFDQSIADARRIAAEDGDYSGAVAKTDQKEIALVRKLDLRIMPTLWAMYFLNYLDR